MQIAVPSSQAARRSVSRSGTRRTSCQPVWCPVYACSGPGHWSRSQPSTHDESGTPSSTRRRKTSTGKRLPTRRPVTSADVTTTVCIPASVRWSASEGRHRVNHPPSTGSWAPVMNDASSDSRNDTAAATSSGSPTRSTSSRCRHERPRLRRAEVAAGDERRRDRTGGHGVHADPSMRELDGERLREHPHATFRRVVVHLRMTGRGHDHLGLDRRHVHDRAASRVADRRRDRARDHVHAFQVRVEHEVPLVLVEVVEGRHAHEPGVVHEVVIAAEGLERGVASGLGLGGHAHVELERDRPAAVVLDARDRLARRRRGGRRRRPRPRPRRRAAAAIARPMPEPAPVTNAVVPEWSKLMARPPGRVERDRGDVDRHAPAVGDEGRAGARRRTRRSRGTARTRRSRRGSAARRSGTSAVARWYASSRVMPRASGELVHRLVAHRRADPARAQRVRAHAPRPAVDRDRLREPDQAGLRRDVGRARARRDEARDRREQHDRAASRRCPACGIAARTRRIAPVRLTSRVVRQASSVTSAAEPPSPTPALATTTSSLPYESSVVATTASRVFGIGDVAGDRDSAGRPRPPRATAPRAGR